MTTTVSRKAGRPAKKISLRKLKILMRYKPTSADAATLVGCHEKTLEKFILKKTGLTFTEFREKYMAPVRYKLQQKLIRMALSGNVAALIFSLKNVSGWTDKNDVKPSDDPPSKRKEHPQTFKYFCKQAGYPAPFLKQIEMLKFGLFNYYKEPKLLLGARNYGKTDYVTILGVAYKIFKNPKIRILIITKSDERNAAIVSEIGNACKKAGVKFEKENAQLLRVQGLIGKDHSLSTLTIRSASFRGRHPDIIIFDDPVTPEDTSPATRKHVKKIYDEAYKLCKNILIIGQPVHKQDLYQTLRPLLRKMEVPYGSIPELDVDLEAQRLAGVDEASIQASFYLNIITDESSPFSDVKYIDEMPAGGGSVLFIDPSFKGGDYTAATCLKGYFSGVAVHGKCWKKAWHHCLNAFVDLIIEQKVERVCIETCSLGEMPVLQLRQALADRGITGIGVVGKDSVIDSKHSRIVNAGASSQYIFLSKKSDREYIEQVVNYEYKAEFDDAPDSLASCLEWVGLVKGKSVK